MTEQEWHDKLETEFAKICLCLYCLWHKGLLEEARIKETEANKLYLRWLSYGGCIDYLLYKDLGELARLSRPAKS